MTQLTAAESLVRSTESLVICIYGASGIGKSTDSGYTYPHGLFLAAPGSLYSVQSVCGYTPESVEVNTLMEATELIRKLGDKKTYRAVVIDDFSHLCEKTFSLLEQKKSGFLLWGALRDAALEFRDAARYARMDVLLSCWEQASKVKDGLKVRGGPQLAGKLPEQIPALCDVVLRATHEPKKRPWPVVYRCSADPNFVMKDRLDVAVNCDPAPMNLGELLRAGGRYIPRLYDDQEEKVEALSQMFSGTQDSSDLDLANEAFKALLASGKSPSEVRWTVRDALDRATIRYAMKLRETSFFEPAMSGAAKLL